MIPFNIPLVTDRDCKNVETALANPKSLQGGGIFSDECIRQMNEQAPKSKVYLTTSCTSALELAAILINIRPGDEIIAPSYTYVSTVNAFLLRGATIVYVDIDPKTMNIDASLVDAAVTRKTRAIVPIHYGGVSCDMDALIAISQRHGIFIIEDAAHAYSATYKGSALGTIGHIGCFSFHATKNYTSGGQGGALMVNDINMHSRADVVFENGTNRRDFIDGKVARYEWKDIGSNFQMGEIAAACLAAQLSMATTVNHERRKIWHEYYKAFLPFHERQILEIPHVPDYAQHNAHVFWVKWRNESLRAKFINFMDAAAISVVFHYVPLHSTQIGRATGRFSGTDVYTSREAGRLTRLPLYYGLSEKEQKKVILEVLEFIHEC